MTAMRLQLISAETLAEMGPRDGPMLRLSRWRWRWRWRKGQRLAETGRRVLSVQMERMKCSKRSRDTTKVGDTGARTCTDLLAVAVSKCRVLAAEVSVSKRHRDSIHTRRRERHSHQRIIAYAPWWCMTMLRLKQRVADEGRSSHLAAGADGGAPTYSN